MTASEIAPEPPEATETVPKPVARKEASRLWQVLSGVGNLAIGAAQVVTGAGATGEHVLVTLGNGIHDVTDGATTWAQVNDDRNSQQGHISRTRRRLLYGTLTASSLYMLIQGGVELAQHHDTPTDANILAVTSTASAFALNASLYATALPRVRYNRRQRSGARLATEDDLLAHTALDTATAFGALVGASANYFGLEVGPLDVHSTVAMVAGACGMYKFWPSNGRIDGGYHHGHGHGHH